MKALKQDLKNHAKIYRFFIKSTFACEFRNDFLNSQKNMDFYTKKHHKKLHIIIIQG